MKLSTALVVAATMISGGIELAPVSTVAASKVAENSQIARAADFSAQRPSISFGFGF